MSNVVVIGPYSKSLVSFRGDMMKSMINKGHTVFAMAPESGYEEKLASMGIQFDRLPLHRTGINPFKDISLFIFLVKKLLKIKPDIVFFYAIKPVIYGSMAAYLAGVKNVYSMITGLGYVFTGNAKKQRALRWFITRLYKMALERNKIVFYQNPDDLDVFLENGILSNHDKVIRVNGSGVDTERYEYSEPVNIQVTFLLIARLIWDKGIGEYVKAAQQLKKKYPSTKFRLVGPFDSNPKAIEEGQVHRWVEEGIIEYLGETDDVRPFIRESSVYVLPSYREGTPRSVLEAMATGRPIVTTDAPGCRETVQVGINGFLVPVKDADKLAEAMEKFIIDPSLITRMGKESREIAVDRFDVHKVNGIILKAMELD